MTAEHSRSTVNNLLHHFPMTQRQPVAAQEARAVTAKNTGQLNP